jgi:hypothetical protein
VRGSPFAYSFSLARPGSEMAVDLHWRPTERHHPAFPQRLDKPWERLIECPVAGATVRTFGLEDTLLYLSAHAAKHGWERLRWIADIAWLLRTEVRLDWSDTLETAAESGPIGERTLLVSLSLAERLFDAFIPAEASRRDRRDPLAESIVAEVIVGLERASDEWPLRWPRSFLRRRRRPAELDSPPQRPAQPLHRPWLPSGRYFDHRYRMPPARHQASTAGGTLPSHRT